jgi:hypothetical protein
MSPSFSATTGPLLSDGVVGAALSHQYKSTVHKRKIIIESFFMSVRFLYK